MSRLLPYETIIQATNGEPEAVNAVLAHYAGYIRYYSHIYGHYNVDMEDYIKTKLIESLSKFRPSQLNNCRHAAAHRAGNQLKVSCFFCALRLPESPFLHYLCEANQRKIPVSFGVFGKPCITQRKGKGNQKTSENLRPFCLAPC